MKSFKIAAGLTAVAAAGGAASSAAAAATVDLNLAANSGSTDVFLAGSSDAQFNFNSTDTLGSVKSTLDANAGAGIGATFLTDPGLPTPGTTFGNDSACFGGILCTAIDDAYVHLTFKSGADTYVGIARIEDLGLKSITYDLAAVPEPATWATMIAGFGLAGAAMRRRRGAMAA